MNIQFAGSRANFRDGTCAKTCDAFATSCGQGKSCGWVVFTPKRVPVYVCKSDGTGGQGAPCAFDDDCLPNHACDAPYTCAALCDSAHPCAGDGGACIDGACR